MIEFSPQEWRRVGGSWVEFGLPLDLFRQCLRDVLPAEFAPYHVAGEDRWLPPGERRVTGHLYCYPLEDLERALAETPERAGYPRAFVHIGSAKLTQALVAPMTGNVRAWLTVNGLPSVDVGRPQADGSRYVGGLSFVRKIVHVETGGVHVHEEYARIHRVLRRALRTASTA